MAAYAAYADARALDASFLPLATDAPLYAKIRQRTRDDGVEALGAIKDYTLIECFRTHNGRRQLLLGMKKRGFGVGKWNGFGGKFDEGENMRECALRELEEESGLVPERMEWQAQLLFTFRDSGKLMRVHVFSAEGFAREPMDTEEMAPRWFDVEDIPYAEMWHDDSFWLARFLRGERFEGWFDYAQGGEQVNRVLAHEIDYSPFWDAEGVAKAEAQLDELEREAEALSDENAREAALSTVTPRGSLSGNLAVTPTEPPRADRNFISPP